MGLRDVGFMFTKDDGHNTINDQYYQPINNYNNIFQSLETLSNRTKKEEFNEDTRDAINAEDVFHIIRTIQDPEHPLTLEQLKVVNIDSIRVHDLLSNNYSDSNDNKTNSMGGKDYNHKKPFSYVNVGFTPTIPHCSMATLIGLCIRVKLLRSIPLRFKIFVKINIGTHVSENAINRQLNDKERVAAALENPNLLSVVNKCIIAPDVDKSII